MIFGEYGGHKEALPRVMHITIARYSREMPRPGEALDFLVSFHEEGAGITWQQNVTISSDLERYFLDTTQQLYLGGLGRSDFTADSARVALDKLGRQLYDAFVGTEGQQFLARSRPTAILLDVDETTLNLPWELMADNYGPLALQYPFGRLVTTRALPRPGRDPLQEDDQVRILAIANPPTDLAAADAEVAALVALAERGTRFPLTVDVLARGEATHANFIQRATGGDYDILHFAGHAAVDPDDPATSALRLADSFLLDDEILALDWQAPPYLVFNSACESGCAAGGQRLATCERQANGLAAAFLAAGCAAHVGCFWPVTDTGAQRFAGIFYDALFGMENVGLAFQEARHQVTWELREAGDLTAYSAVLFGDAASGKRPDLAKMR
ncbi:MAG: CHAT domain-containing protein [Anaerolineae bacterium]